MKWYVYNHTNDIIYICHCADTEEQACAIALDNGCLDVAYAVRA